MGAIKLVQTWSPIPGRKQEYAAFVTATLDKSPGAGGDFG